MNLINKLTSNQDMDYNPQIIELRKQRTAALNPKSPQRIVTLPKAFVPQHKEQSLWETPQDSFLVFNSQIQHTNPKHVLTLLI